MSPNRRERPADGGGPPGRRFTVPDEPTLGPEQVEALRASRLELQRAAHDDEPAMLTALQRYVRAACAAGFARLTVRHTVAAALLAAAGRDAARRARVQRWLGYVDRLYDAHGPR
jgi:hypothetical protein